MANSWNESGTTWGTDRWGTTDAITSGWGADVWNTGGSWGQATDEIVFPTGISASFSLGDVVAYSEQGWGRDAWSDEPWGESFDPVVSVEGLGLTASLGDAEEFNETGWGRLSWNQADWNEGADETISVSGLEATSSIGSITPAFTYLLEMIGANHSMTTSVGSLQVDGEIGVPITGVEAEFATPTMGYAGTLVGWGRDGWNDNSWGESPNQVITLVGRSMEASVSGSNSWGENTWNSNEVWGGVLDVTIEIGQPLTGQEATTNVGSFSFVISPTISLTGQAATVSVDDLGLAFGVSTEPISSVSSTVSLGTLGLEFGPSEITGVSATTSVGELTTGAIELLNLTGVSSTVSVGSLAPADVVGLTGVSATVSVGTISPADVVQGLITSEITSSLGLLGIQAYANIDTGSNTSYTSVATGSNNTYSDVSTGSNTSYSNVSTGSNDTYSDVATGSNTSYTDAA
jgi:hypothetical protein